MNNILKLFDINQSNLLNHF